MRMKKMLVLLLSLLILIPNVIVSAETVTTSGTNVTAEQTAHTWGISIYGRSNQIPDTVVNVSVLYPGVDINNVGVSGILSEQNAYTGRVLVDDTAEGNNFSLSFPLKDTDKGGVYKVYVYIPGESGPILVNVPCMNENRRAGFLQSAQNLESASELVAALDISIGDVNAVAGESYADYNTEKKTYLAQYIIDNRTNWKDTPAAKTDEEKLTDLSEVIGKVATALDLIETLSSAGRAKIEEILDADVLAQAQGGEGVLLLPSTTIAAYGGLTSSQKENAIVAFEATASGIVFPADVDTVLLAAIEEAKKYEAPGSSGSGSGGGSSGGSSGGGLFVGASDELLDLVAGEEKPSAPNEFTDLASTPWAVNAVNILAARGVISGRGDGKFYPADQVSRAEFVKMLITAFEIRLTSQSVLPFKDVEFGAWYYEPILIAYQKEIVNGVSDTAFEPNAPLTRQDMAVLLYKAMSVVNLVISDAGKKPAFIDGESIASYAAGAVETLSQGGIITGRDDGSFDPLATANRAEAAAIIYRVMYRFSLL